MRLFGTLILQCARMCQAYMEVSSMPEKMYCMNPLAQVTKVSFRESQKCPSNSFRKNLVKNDFKEETVREKVLQLRNFTGFKQKNHPYPPLHTKMISMPKRPSGRRPRSTSRRIAPVKPVESEWGTAKDLYSLQKK